MAAKTVGEASGFAPEPSDLIGVTNGRRRRRSGSGREGEGKVEAKRVAKVLLSMPIRINDLPK